MIDIKENAELNVLNHSCAHMMAQAVKRLYPQAKFWVGPVVSEGFYYDMDLGDEVIKDEDLPKIEKEMKKIAKDGKRIVRKEITKAEALEMFKDDPYKIDLIQDLEDGTITCYQQGEFIDLCRGPVSYTHLDVYKRQHLKESEKVLPKSLPKRGPILFYVHEVHPQNKLPIHWLKNIISRPFM